MNSKITWKYVWWRKLLCMVGIHRLSEKWSGEFFNLSAHTHCVYCNTVVDQKNNWAINWDTLRKSFRSGSKYENSLFWRTLTPKWNRVYLLDYLGDIVAVYRNDGPAFEKEDIDLVDFAKNLKLTTTIEIEIKSYFGRRVWVKYTALEMNLILASG